MRANLVWILLWIILCQPVAGEWSAGRAALARHDCATAEREFQEVVERFPHLAMGYYMLGVAHRECARLELAEQTFRQAIALDQRYSLYRLAYAQVLLESSRPEQAYDLLAPLELETVAREHRTRYALLLARSATTAEHAGKIIPKLEAVIAENPDDYRLYRALGTAQDQCHQLAAAYRSFKKAFELDPQGIDSGRAAVRAAVALARTITNTNRRKALYRYAALVAERLSQLQSDFNHLLLAGEAWLLAGKPVTARTWINKAHQLRPRSAVVFLRRAQCSAETGSWEAARHDLQEALRIGVRGRLRREVYNELGRAYLHVGEYRLAISAYRIADNPEMLAQANYLAQSREPR